MYIEHRVWSRLWSVRWLEGRRECWVLWFYSELNGLEGSNSLLQRNSAPHTELQREIRLCYSLHVWWKRKITSAKVCDWHDLALMTCMSMRLAILVCPYNMARALAVSPLMFLSSARTPWIIHRIKNTEKLTCIYYIHIGGVNICSYII